MRWWLHRLFGIHYLNPGKTPHTYKCRFCPYSMGGHP